MSHTPRSVPPLLRSARHVCLKKKTFVPTSFCRRANPKSLVWGFPEGGFCEGGEISLWDPRSGVTPKWDFGVAMLPVGALCFYQAHFGPTVLPKWPFWANLFYSVFYSVSELRRACFRQARVARAVLSPGALFRAGAIAFPPCAPKSHMRPLPHLGVSDLNNWGRARTGCNN